MHQTQHKCTPPLQKKNAHRPGVMGDEWRSQCRIAGDDRKPQRQHTNTRQTQLLGGQYLWQQWEPTRDGSSKCWQELALA